MVINLSKYGIATTWEGPINDELVEEILVGNVFEIAVENASDGLGKAIVLQQLIKDAINRDPPLDSSVRLFIRNNYVTIQIGILKFAHIEKCNVTMEVGIYKGE